LFKKKCVNCAKLEERLAKAEEWLGKAISAIKILAEKK
jgi:hypothetical protein